jgi:4a-hydroxytetrahydrobiopterin dehydratase
MSTAELAKNACVPCKGGVPPLKGEALHTMHAQLGADWQLINEHHLEKEYKLKGYAPAVAFTNAVAAVAEEQNHHPDILLAWGKVKVSVWTHKIDGLTESDFFFAAKVEEAFRKMS